MKKNNLKNILSYIINNRFLCFIMFVGFFMLIFLMRHVVMYADDYALKVISDAGWSNILKNQYKHYFQWGGGFTPLLVTSFLRFDFALWKIFISILIFSMFALIIKIMNLKTDLEKCLAAILLISCLFFLPIQVSRETIYWLDGSMAYIFTTFQLFIYIYYFITRVLNDVTKKYDIILFPILSFFAGWSSAQTGAIALIVPTLIILYSYFIKNKKVKKFYHIINFLGILGFFIFYFAPGNTSRMNIIKEFVSLSFFDKILYRIGTIFTFMFDFKSVEYASTPFFILLMFALLSIYGITKLKQDKRLRSNIFFKVSTIYLVFILLINLCVFLNFSGIENISKYFINFSNLYDNDISLTILLPYIFNILAMISSLIISYFIAKMEKLDLAFIFPLIIYGSQAVMVMAPYSEYRTMIISIIFLWAEITILFMLLYRKRYNIGYLAFIPLIIFNINVSIFLILYYGYQNSFKSSKSNIVIGEYILVLIILGSFALINYFESYDKYHINRLIYENNIQILKQSNNDDIIYLYDPQYIYYGFGGIVNNGLVEEPVKTLYNIKESAIFKLVNKGE